VLFGRRYGCAGWEIWQTMCCCDDEPLIGTLNHKASPFTNFQDGGRCCLLIVHGALHTQPGLYRQNKREVKYDSEPLRRDVAYCGVVADVAGGDCAGAFGCGFVETDISTLP
jgi:hypothetical protein